MKNLKNFIVIIAISSAFATSVKCMDDEIDCADLRKNLLQALSYHKAKGPRYKDLGFNILEKNYEKCKNLSPDRDSLAQTTYYLGRSYWFGMGVAKNYPKACGYFNEVLKAFPDIKDNQQVVPWSHYFIGDGARNGHCEKENWEKAVSHYQEIISHQEADPNLVAWVQGRLGDAYREGKGVKQDHAQSLKSFTSILENDKKITDKSIVAWAKYWWADAYQHGKTVKQDPEKAHGLYAEIVENYKSVDPIAVEYAQAKIKEMQAG